MKLLDNRRGVFYLIIAVLFVAVMLFVFLAYEQYSFSERQEVVETRLRTVNDFIKDIDSDSKRVIYISGFRALIAIEDYVASKGEYLNNTEEMFRIAFYNGTVNNTPVEIMENATYSDYLEELRLLADRIGLDITLNVTKIELYQDSPWSVKVVATTSVNITDQRGLAAWEFTKDYNTSVSLINIRDPIYSVFTHGRMPNTIRITNVTDYVDDATNDTRELRRHINNSFYTENLLAPSYLMRIEGNFSSSPYGIESLVYIPELINQDVNYSSAKSIVDYVLFSNITGYDEKACDVQNMPSWFKFKIDLNHTSDYEVNDLNYTTC